MVVVGLWDGSLIRRHPDAASHTLSADSRSLRLKSDLDPYSRRARDGGRLDILRLHGKALCIVKHKVGVLGFEPGLQKSLELLLQRETDLTVVPVSLSEASAEPDTLIISPSNPEWVEQVRRRYPRARLLAMVDWHRRHQFSDSRIDDYVESLMSYTGLLDQLRQLHP